MAALILEADDGNAPGHLEKEAETWMLCVEKCFKSIMEQMIPRSTGPVNDLEEFMKEVWNLKTGLEGVRYYRGQADSWPLLPRLLRGTERDVEVLRRREYTLLERFRTGSIYLLPSIPESAYDLMSLAQHYGLDTRLLDWSSNPLMALFFSVDAPNPPAPTVYIYDATSEQLTNGMRLHGQAFISENPTTLLFSPTTHSQRVVAQAGFHTVHSMHSGIQPLESSAEDAKRITVISINSHNATKIRWELRGMGIHSATVYGDLASVCREIQYGYDFPKQP